MDPITVATIALGLISAASTAAQKYGKSTPDWIKYVDAGLYVSKEALTIIANMKDHPSDYDTLTAAQIRDLLTPPTWAELELQVAAEDLG